MPASNVFGFSESIPTKTIEQGRAFVARMRRQLDRFEVAFPGTNGKPLAPEYEAKIRRICDDMEADIRRTLGDI